MGSLTKCVPEICGSVQKKLCSYVLFDLAAQGCLQCPKRLQKWKAQAICDRSYVPFFFLRCITYKVMIPQSSKGSWPSKQHDLWKLIAVPVINSSKEQLKLIGSNLESSYSWQSSALRSLRSHNFAPNAPQKEKWYIALIANCLNFPFLQSF